jgi:hypothetical protein
MQTHTDRLYQKRLCAFHRMVAVPECGADSYDACVPAICRGEDSLKLADEFFNLNVALNDSSRPYLAQWAANNAGPIVAGKALITAWQRGHGGSIMGRFTDHTILKWFRRAAPEGLMDEAERKVFNNLPDIVTAYRGAREDMPEDAVGGLSWTLDLKVAVFFARDYHFGRKGPAVVVGADFPRSAIVAYTDGRSERELILDWRRFRNRAYVPEAEWPAKSDKVALPCPNTHCPTGPWLTALPNSRRPSASPSAHSSARRRTAP